MVETHVSLRPEEDWPRRLIEKEYLHGLAMSMLEELEAGGFLAGGEDATSPQKIAVQVEGMSRATLNRDTRKELMKALNAGMASLREGYEMHREQALREGTAASRFSEQELEDKWAKDILRQAMVRIQQRIHERIIEQVPQDLIEILASQNALSSKSKDEAMEHLRKQWSGQIRPDNVPLVQTTFEELSKEEMQRDISIPGMPNWWLMPIETRIGMLTTGMRGLLGLKVYGSDLKKLETLGVELEGVLKDIPGTQSVVAERVMGGHYLDVTVDRKECARHGLRVGDVQRIIETALGGMNIASTIEGRYRFPISVRYPSELRDNPEKLKRTLVSTPQGHQIPLGQVATIAFVDGPPMIKSEAGQLLLNIPVAIDSGLDIGTYVSQAQAAIDRSIAEGRVTIPPGYNLLWSGQYEFMQQVRKRLTVIIPIVVAIIFVLIYFTMKSVTETLITMFTLPFALIGGVWGMYFLDYNWSVAVAIGFIALAGLAAETGIIMHVYLDLAYKRHRKEKGRNLTPDELQTAVIEGAVLRVRPKLMTVLTDFIALLPILWATTPGAGPMKRIAIPLIAGVITSAVHTLVLIPVYYTLYKRYEQWRGGGGEPDEN
jgi:Cu(I)/Ag(I) efflux system membrane protein CusA/SilA